MQIDLNINGYTFNIEKAIELGLLVKLAKHIPTERKIGFSDLKNGDIFTFTYTGIDHSYSGLYLMRDVTSSKTGQCTNLTKNYSTWFDKQHDDATEFAVLQSDGSWKTTIVE